MCVGTWTNIVRGGLSDAAPATTIPELKVTPDRYLTVRYAGASGDFNPIHIDEDFAKQVGLPGRILHGLWTMAQVARAQTEAGGGPHSLRRLQVQFRGMGLPEHEITVTGTVARGARRRRGRAHGGRAGRQGDHPQRRGRARRRRVAPPTIGVVLTPAPRADPAQGRRGPHGDRRARGLQDARRRPRPRLRAVDDPQRARDARGARAARASAHERRARADRRRPPLLRRSPAAGPDVARGARSTCSSCAARSTRRCASRPRRSRRSRTCWRSSRRRRSTPPRSATSRSCCCSPRS